LFITTEEKKLFNSLKYAKILEEAGLPRNQAETHIQILGDVMSGEIATKEDIRKIEYDLQSLEQRIVLKLGGLMAAFLATGLTVAKLLFV